jgi:hypothetical protein
LIRWFSTYSVMAMTNLALPHADRGAPTPVPRRRLFTVCLYLLRTLATAHALLACSQAVTIGQYLDGHYALVRLHGIVASNLILLAAALGAISVGYVIARGRPWPAIGCVPLFFIDGIQTGMGYQHRLGVHVPLGVAIVAGSLAIAVWSWTRAAGQPR